MVVKNRKNTRRQKFILFYTFLLAGLKYGGIPKISFPEPSEVGENQCIGREKEEEREKIFVNNGQLHLITEVNIAHLAFRF